MSIMRILDKNSSYYDVSNNTFTSLTDVTQVTNDTYASMSGTFSTTAVVMDAVTNATETLPIVWGPKILSTEHLVLVSVFLGLMILATIIGNVFVIAAIILEKNLHNVANYLILSLAVADLMVASLVMPISIVNEVSETWFIGPEICDMWISFDVLCCTASILHLVAISVDRYWAVTNIDYVRNRSAKTILMMIGISWVVGMCISIPPLFGWKEPANNPEITGKCLISQDILYTIFSTFGAFYVPTFMMMVIYAKIYQVARRRIRKKNFHKKSKRMAAAAASSPSTALTKVDNASCSNLLNSPQLNNGHNNGVEITMDSTCNGMNNGFSDKNENSKMQTTNGNCADDAKLAMLPKSNKDAMKAKKHKEKLEKKRERKAARTLGIITAAYIFCWLPFFVGALSAPLLPKEVAEDIPPIFFSITLWLGYCNSLLNPILYTIFSPEFRNAFQKILFGKYSRKYRR